VLGYSVSPLLALVSFVWMIAYHAITSEGLHANRLARSLTRTRLARHRPMMDRARG